MGSFIEKFLDFRQKPRDAAVGGHPLTQESQLGLIWRNRTTASTGVRVIAKVYNPKDDTTETRVAIGPLTSANTDFSGEASTLSGLGTFSNGELLVAVSVTASSAITDPTQLWAFVLLREKSNSAISIPLCQGYVWQNNVVGWTAGSPAGFQSTSTADAGTQGALFTFQGEVTNGAGGAGDQSLTIAPATGGRVQLLTADIENADTANRTGDISILDPTNRVSLLMTGTINAANVSAWPNGSAQSATSNGANGTVLVAGANTIRMRVLAVAASQNSLYGVTLRVWGGAPTFTLAGASTPTLTTNTSRFETG